MTKVLICGANGMMGQVLSQTAEKTEDITVCCGVDLFPDAKQNDFPVFKTIEESIEQPDVIIDFSRPEAIKNNLSYAVKKGVPVVIATTGLSDEEKALITDASIQIPVFFAANMSLGVNLQMELCKKAAEFLDEAYDIEIIEKHHNQKVDAPSGTALAIAESINSALKDKKEFNYGRHTKTEKRGREIGIHAVRGGTIVGEHSVLFAGTDEVIEIKHEAQSKQIFAHGALRAASFIVNMPAGLYSMNDMLTQKPVTKITETKGQAMLTLANLKYSPSVLSEIFNNIAENGIKLDMISQTAPSDGYISLSVTMNESDINGCLSVAEQISNCSKSTIKNLTKLTVEGSGMQTQSGVASMLFEALAKNDIEICIISTSETMIGFCVEEKCAGTAVNAISDAFSL